MISIVRHPGATYPDRQYGFSPDERFPEYRYASISPHPNEVYRMLREAFWQGGLDRDRFGTPAWNPLGDLIPEGSRVFVLCNFVFHKRPGERARDQEAKCVHGSVLRALVDYILIAAGREGRVCFGNAPVQSCNWHRVLDDTGAGVVEAFYRGEGEHVEARDLRLAVAERDALGRIVRRLDALDTSAGVEIDLGRASFLEEVAAGGKARFRVSDYDPGRTESFHRSGSHKYVVHRAVLESDVVVSLSKLKTHEKVGFTCTLKGFVGAVAHKDCLAHHRFGCPDSGGDEYPATQKFLRPLSEFHDWLNRRPDDAALQSWARVVDRVVRGALRKLGVTSAGSWHGNDTAWRMALDLARIVHFAGRDGTLGSRLERRHLALIDGIVGGEGDGPLAPQPVASETLLFSTSAAEADEAACRLLGFDRSALPLLRELHRTGIPSSGATGDPELVFNGESVVWSELEPVLSRPFRAPRGWRRRLGARGN